MIENQTEPTPRIPKSERDKAVEYVRDLIITGAKPVITVPKKYVEIVKERGLSEHPTWIPGTNRIVGTLGRKPYGGEDRVAFSVDVNPDEIEPRFTGPDVEFRGVVGFKIKHIPPENLHII